MALLHLGKTFDRITARSVQMGNGETDRAVIHLAGVAGEVIAGSDGAEAWKRCETDGNQARKWAARALERRGLPVTERALEAELQAEWQKALEILRGNWPAVKAIAQLVGQLGKVDYDVARFVFNEVRQQRG